MARCRSLMTALIPTRRSLLKWTPVGSTHMGRDQRAATVCACDQYRRLGRAGSSLPKLVSNYPLIRIYGTLHLTTRHSCAPRALFRATMVKQSRRTWGPRAGKCHPACWSKRWSCRESSKTLRHATLCSKLSASYPRTVGYFIFIRSLRMPRGSAYQRQKRNLRWELWWSNLKRACENSKALFASRWGRLSSMPANAGGGTCKKDHRLSNLSQR